MTITSTAINASIIQGEAYSATVSGTWGSSNLGSGSVYLQVSDSAGAFTLPMIQSAPASNTFSYSLPIVADVASGERTGTLSVRACKDATCSSTYPNASGSVAYRLVVNPVPDWETLQGNAAHDGYVPIQLDPAKFAKAWEWIAPLLQGKDVAQASHISTGSNGAYLTILNYINAGGDFGWTQAALDEATGNLRWSRKVEGEESGVFITGTAYKAGKLYFGIGNDPSRGMSALDAATGTVLFNASIPGVLSTTPPVLHGGSTYLAVKDTFGAKLAAVDAATGADRWSQVIEQRQSEQTTVAPAVDSNYVYFHDACCIMLLDRQTGTLAGSIETPHPQQAVGKPRSEALVLGSRGNVISLFRADYFTEFLLASYNIATRAREWVTPVDYITSPAVANGVVYAARMENGRTPSLQALDETTGAVLWTWSPPAGEADAEISGNIVVTRNLVFFSTGSSGNISIEAGRLWAIDVATRQVVWSYPAGGDIAISANRMLYLVQKRPAAMQSKLIAFRLR